MIKSARVTSSAYMADGWGGRGGGRGGVVVGFGLRGCRVGVRAVGTLPVWGGLFCLLAFSPVDGGYWQLAPRPAGAAKAGSCPDADGAELVAEVAVDVAADAVWLPESRLVTTTVATMAPITTSAATLAPTIV